jgi:hypothetical protein
MDRNFIGEGATMTLDLGQRNSATRISFVHQASHCLRVNTKTDLKVTLGCLAECILNTLLNVVVDNGGVCVHVHDEKEGIRMCVTIYNNMATYTTTDDDQAGRRGTTSMQTRPCLLKYMELRRDGMSKYRII